MLDVVLRGVTRLRNTADRAIVMMPYALCHRWSRGCQCRTTSKSAGKTDKCSRHRKYAGLLVFGTSSIPSVLFLLPTSIISGHSPLLTPQNILTLGVPAADLGKWFAYLLSSWLHTLTNFLVALLKPDWTNCWPAMKSLCGTLNYSL
jgi:hypothetical protein